jgi:hypothetical protein
MNISLSEEGKKMSFKEFKDTFGKHFEARPKLDIKKEYERLTGRAVRSTTKKAK